MLASDVGQPESAPDAAWVEKKLATALAGYEERAEWGNDDGSPDEPCVAGLSPLPCITAVGEQLCALTPQLKRQKRDKGQVHWLPAALDSMVEAIMHKVVQIKKLSPSGLQQLIADLEHLHKVTEGLSSAGTGAASSAEDGSAAGGAAAAATGATTRLEETLKMLQYLAETKKMDAHSRRWGEVHIEAPRMVSPTEKALRKALGLGGAEE